MPFINTKVTVKMTPEQEETIKKKLGEAISLIPGKSEAWLMVGFEDGYQLYFKGEAFPKLAFVEVSVFGGISAGVSEKMTAEISRIYEEVLGIPSDKIYVKYTEVENWGWNGRNL